MYLLHGWAVQTIACSIHLSLDGWRGPHSPVATTTINMPRQHPFPLWNVGTLGTWLRFTCASYLNELPGWVTWAVLPGRRNTSSISCRANLYHDVLMSFDSDTEASGKVPLQQRRYRNAFKWGDLIESRQPAERLVTNKIYGNAFGWGWTEDTHCECNLGKCVFQLSIYFSFKTELQYIKFRRNVFVSRRVY